jgi:mono/diheme cytochrome c family protein
MIIPSQQSRRAIAAVLSGILVAGAGWTALAGETIEVFVKSCASCHGRDGKAETPIAKKLGVKDLSQSTLTDAQIGQQIREGKQENQTAVKMPAFKDRLTAEEIKSLVAAVKDFRKQPEPKSATSP